jgi:hypothetical protein
MSCVRIVPVVALAWKADAGGPAVRVRLNALAARTSQALLAPQQRHVIDRVGTGNHARDQRQDLKQRVLAARPVEANMLGDKVTQPGRSASSRPAHDPRLGSSKTEVTPCWTRIQRMPFCDLSL